MSAATRMSHLFEASPVDTNSQIDRIGYRVFVICERGTRLLLIANGPRLALPEIHIPAFARVAESVTTTMRRQWALEIVCLYPIQAYGRNLRRYYLVEALQTHQTIPQAVWVSVSSLTKDSFSDSADYQALLTCLEQCCHAPNPNSAAFESAGWFATVCRWIDEVIQASGLYLTGEFQQFNASPAFSLIRFQTNRSAVWFKAVGKPNVREFHISQYLAETFPAFAPRILGTSAKSNAWLMLEVEGIHPDSQSDIDVWTTAARTLARMQITSVGHVLHLTNAGCRDMRIS
ncbi:MAG: hypothetical protein JO260_07145, partial [Acidobacteria bacterium]|nr:hypothetical protein [Acidobacteriota bacterium]